MMTTRALAPGGDGNITDVQIKGGMVTLVSGIDTTKDIQAGPDRVSLIYAQYQEQGTATIPARPFLAPGFKDWNEQELPQLLDELANDLRKIYNGR